MPHYLFYTMLKHLRQVSRSALLLSFCNDRFCLWRFVKNLKSTRWGAFFRLFLVSQVIITAHVHKSGVIFILSGSVTSDDWQKSHETRSHALDISLSNSDVYNYMSGVFCTNNAQAPSLFSNVTLTSRRSYVETVSGKSALLQSNGTCLLVSVTLEKREGACALFVQKTPDMFTNLPSARKTLFV